MSPERSNETMAAGRLPLKNGLGRRVEVPFVLKKGTPVLLAVEDFTARDIAGISRFPATMRAMAETASKYGGLFCTL